MTLAEDIVAMATHVERANWLIQCPDWDVVASIASIQRGLELALFPEGLAFVKARHRLLQCSRILPFGDLPQPALMAVNMRFHEMTAAAKARDGGEHG